MKTLTVAQRKATITALDRTLVEQFVDPATRETLQLARTKLQDGLEEAEASGKRRKSAKRSVSRMNAQR